MTYNFNVITTFRKPYEIEADSEEEAYAILEEMLGDIDALDTDDFDTEIEAE